MTNNASPLLQLPHFTAALVRSAGVCVSLDALVAAAWDFPPAYAPRSRSAGWDAGCPLAVTFALVLAVMLLRICIVSCR